MRARAPRCSRLAGCVLISKLAVPKATHIRHTRRHCSPQVLQIHPLLDALTAAGHTHCIECCVTGHW